MSLISTRTRALLQKPEIQNLLTISLVTGAISSAAGAYIVTHLDSKTSVRKEVWTAIGLGTLTTLLSVGYKFYKLDQQSRSQA
jgi:ABC-type Mn2+/Zn2+ transport system permease subunit